MSATQMSTCNVQPWSHERGAYCSTISYVKNDSPYGLEHYRRLVPFLILKQSRTLHHQKESRLEGMAFSFSARYPSIRIVSKCWRTVVDRYLHYRFFHYPACVASRLSIAWSQALRCPSVERTDDGSFSIVTIRQFHKSSSIQHLMFFLPHC